MTTPGPTTALGSFLNGMLKEATEAGMATLRELIQTGFDTNNIFDPEFLTGQMTQGAPYKLVSRDTGTEYFVQGHEQVGNAFKVYVQVYDPDRKNENFFPMTLTRADNGSIRADAGW